MDNLFDQAAERIGRAYERGLLSQSHFHLSACGGCGGPSFQQPCALCGFYPMGQVRPSDISPPATVEKFRRSVERSLPDGKGNLATWYFRNGIGKTVAYENNPRWRAAVDALMADAARWEGLPSPDAVFEHVVTQKQRIRRPDKDWNQTGLWRAVFEVRSILEREIEQSSRGKWGGPGTVELRRKVNEASAQAVAAIHGEEEAWETALEGLTGAISEMMRMVPSGNLRSAQAEIDGIRERRQQAVGAPGI